MPRTVRRKPKRMNGRRRTRLKPSWDPPRIKKPDQSKLAHLGVLDTARKSSQVGRRLPRLEDLGGILSGTTTLERLLGSWRVGSRKPARGRPETFCADQSGCMIYGRRHSWETPTKGEDGSGTNRCPGIEPATYSNSPSNASRACRVVRAFGVELRSSRAPVTR